MASKSQVKNIMKQPVSVECYGAVEEYKTRSEAIDHFLEGALVCDGAESERYMNLYIQLTTTTNTFVSDRNW